MKRYRTHNFLGHKKKFYKLLSFGLILGLLVGIIQPTMVEAAGERDLIYISTEIESTDGSDLWGKIKSDPNKYFILRNDSSNSFTENTLNKTNWESILDTEYPTSVNNAYWNQYFVDNIDKLEYEIVDGGIRTCHHYAAYEVLDVCRRNVSSGRWYNSSSWEKNGDGSGRYQSQGINPNGGYIEAPASDFIGYDTSSSGNGKIRFNVGKFSWSTDGDWDSCWGVWTARERAISYNSIDGNGKLLGAGTAFCSHIDENYNKWLPWMIAYPTDNGGSHNAYCCIAAIMFPSLYSNNSQSWYNPSGYQYVKFNDSYMYVNYTWGNGNSYKNQPVTISALGTNYNNCWWNVPNSPFGWSYDSSDGEYYAPDMTRQIWYTNPGYGGKGMHLNGAVAKLLGEDACQYHTSDAHVDLDGAYYKGGSYNLSVNAWKHQVHFYSIKVYLKNDRTVSYNANGGSGTMASQTAMVGTSITIKDNSFTRTGYRFDTNKAWNTKADGTGTKYSQGYIYTGNNDLTLYAQWLINTSNLKVNPNGGIYNNTTDVTEYRMRNYKTTQSVPDPTRANYTFVRWDYSPTTLRGTFNTSTKVYTFGSTHNVTDTLTAVWTPNVYKIICDKQGGSGGVNDFYEVYATGFRSTKTSTTNITSISVPTRTGYTLEGYYSGKDGTGTEVVSETGSILVSNTYFTKDTTIYAYWKPNSYEVNIYNNKPNTSTGDIQNIK